MSVVVERSRVEREAGTAHVQPDRAKLLGAFAIVYLVWGSTFLAARIGVQDMPPLLFAAGRSLLAGLLLLAVAAYRGQSLPKSLHDWQLMGVFALILACGRWLELKLDSPGKNVAGFISVFALFQIGVILMFYREPLY